MFDNYTNKYARWIRAIAVIVIVAGVLFGLVILVNQVDFHFVPFITVVAYAAGIAIFMFGFAEVIEILYRIHQRLGSVEEVLKSRMPE